MEKKITELFLGAVSALATLNATPVAAAPAPSDVLATLNSPTVALEPAPSNVVATLNLAPAAPAPAPWDVLRANSFAELLEPIPNAVALLKAIDESGPASRETDEHMAASQPHRGRRSRRHGYYG